MKNDLSKKMQIAVLLTCHNRKLKTEKCLISLGVALEKFNQNCKDDEKIFLEIFLVDDGCTDGTADVASKIVNYGELHILRGDGNLYWAGGMRFCWREAMKRHDEWDYYLLINDDTVMMDNLFDDLLSAEKYTKVHFSGEGIVSGITCASDDLTKLTYGGDIILNRFLSTKRRLKPNGIPQLCDQTNANILLVPHHVVDKIGIFYDGYIHGFADTDYSRMARRKGVPVVLTANFCGICDCDHDDAKERAKKLMGMSLNERKTYFRHPLHSNREYLLSTWRNAPLRFPMVWIGRMLNVYFPRVYYKLNGIR